MGFSIVKFFGGFAFWKGAVIGKLIYIAIIIAVCLGIYHVLFIKRTEVVNAETVQNITQSRTHLIEFEAGIFKLRLL